MRTPRILLMVILLLTLQYGQAFAQHANRTPQNYHLRLAALERIEPKKRSDAQRVELGRAYFKAERLDEAYAQASAALQDGSANADAWILQGDVLRERGKWRSALSAFDLAAKLAPRRADIELRRGQALQALGKTREADRAYARYRNLTQIQFGQSK